MIIKNGNDIQYGVQLLQFDTLQEFESYTGWCEQGTRAYVIETQLTYVLGSNSEWYIYQGE